MSDTTLPAWPKKPWREYPESVYGIEVWSIPDIAGLDAFDAEVAKVQSARDEITGAEAAKFRAAVEAVTALGFKAKGDRLTGKRKRDGTPERETMDLAHVLRWFMPVSYRAPAYLDQKPTTASERKWIADKAKREAEKATHAKRTAEADALATRAAAWLMAKGKVLGTDFTVGTALDVANEIAAEEERARLIAAGQPIGFNGDDYCEGCEGWIPGHHRCTCGNRRVSFSTHDGHTFENVAVYAEAY